MATPSIHLACLSVEADFAIACAASTFARPGMPEAAAHLVDSCALMLCLEFVLCAGANVRSATPPLGPSICPLVFWHFSQNCDKMRDRHNRPTAGGASSPGITHRWMDSGDANYRFSISIKGYTNLNALCSWRPFGRSPFKCRDAPKIPAADSD
jgi:hypothetical protein